MDVTNDKHHREVLGGLNALRARSELTDVVLEVEGRSFPCHRAVLAACSPYFSSMFTSGYAEDKQRSVRIQDVSHVAMATILDYAYTGCLKIEPDQVQAVMSAARLLQLDFVSQKAAEYIKAHLDVSNCTDVLMYADMLGDLTLQEASERYMASRFNQVALQQSFLQLSLPQLQSVLNRDDLVPSSEDKVVQAALRWIDFDQEERLPQLPALCKSFRHSLIGAQCRVELERKCLSTDCKLVYDNSATQRLGQMRVETLIFLKDDSRLSSIDSLRTAPCYDPSSSMIYSINMPFNLDSFSLVVTPDDELYLAGGINLTGPVTAKVTQKTFFQYNHLLNAWEARCDMISPRCSCGLVYHKGYIYAIGGTINLYASDGTMNQTAERYDPSCDEWTSIAPLPSPILMKPCAVSLDDGIYVISEEGCYCFSPTENTWNKIADLLTPAPFRPQAVAYQGCICCLNRMTDTCWIEMYTPKDNVWKCCENSSPYCYDVILIPYQGNLYFLTINEDGDWRPTGYRLNLYQYQPEKNCSVKVENAGGMIPPMPWWLGRTRQTDILQAKMIPTCLGDDIGEYKAIPDSPEYDSPEYEEEDDGYYLRMFAQNGVLNDSD